MKTLSWLGTVASILGSFAVSFHYFPFGYSMFIIGSISWLIIGAKRADKPLLVLNAFFFVANLIGMYNAV